MSNFFKLLVVVKVALLFLLPGCRFDCRRSTPKTKPQVIISIRTDNWNARVAREAPSITLAGQHFQVQTNIIGTGDNREYAIAIADEATKTTVLQLNSQETRKGPEIRIKVVASIPFELKTDLHSVKNGKHAALPAIFPPGNHELVLTSEQWKDEPLTRPANR